jgi:ketosteroid isomerase-like protein
MSKESNLAVVQSIYSAFGAGDVDAILSQLTDDVDWSAESAAYLAPWHGRKHGKAEVPSFFSALAETVEVTEFTPLAFGTSENDVFVTIRFGAKARATGKSASMELHHWWTLRDGKVCRYRGAEDTALTQSILTK